MTLNALLLFVLSALPQCRRPLARSGKAIRARGGHLGGQDQLGESQLPLLRLYNTFHGWHSVANVEFGPNGNAKVIAIQPPVSPGGAPWRRPIPNDLGLTSGLFVALVVARRADA